MRCKYTSLQEKYDHLIIKTNKLAVMVSNIRTFANIPLVIPLQFTDKAQGINAREISLLQDLCSNIIGLYPFTLIFFDARLVR